MLIDRALIQKAKEILGDKNADIMAELLDLKNYDKENKKALCCWHEEKTPSLIYNPKNYSFHCFGCSRTIDLIGVYMDKGDSYVEAVKKLFDLAGINYPFGEHNVKTTRDYKYPVDDSIITRDNVNKYWLSRYISSSTLDHFRIKEDANHNTMFNYFDTNDVLTLIKYRPSHKIEKGETKTWCQKDADTAPLLFNMNKVNPEMPLVVTEGEGDAMSVYESGYGNVVSVPFGANNTKWIEYNFEWLQQFKEIIICSDNDSAGQKMQKEIVPRLGNWRCKYVELPDSFMDELSGEIIPVKDANDVLCTYGKEHLLKLILNAKDTPINGVIDFADIEDIDLDKLDGIYTGFKNLDNKLMKLFFGNLIILTGINGCVDCDTEYFNGKEWKKISQYQEGEKVLQYNIETDEASLIKPIDYIKLPCDYMYEFNSIKGTSQCLSPEHRVLWYDRAKIPHINTCEEIVEKHNKLISGFQGTFNTAFKYEGDGISLTDEQIRIMCAVICDGHFPKRKRTTPICRINLKKDRKKNRLEKLLRESNIQFRKEQYNPKDLKFNTYLFYSPIVAKKFDKMWYQCNTHQLQIIADEILYWDGAKGKTSMEYSTNVKENADFIQFVFSSLQKRASITVVDRIGNHHKNNKYIYKTKEYTVTINNKRYCAIGIEPKSIHKKNVIHKIKPKDGYKYCFTVPQDTLVLRRDNKIFITKNSGKSSFLNQVISQTLNQNYDAFLYSGELPNQQAKNWLLYQLAGRYNLKEKTSLIGNQYFVVDEQKKKSISSFYKRRLYVYDESQPKTSVDIMNTMEGLAVKRGVKLYVLDNLTAINLGANENNKYEKQAEFIVNLTAFAAKYNVLIILVVHPHKIENMRRMSKMDIQGSMAMTDLAHRVISLYRVKTTDQDEQKKKSDSHLYKYNVILDILKDRMTGYEGYSMGLYYDKASRRFYTNKEELDFQYKWDKEFHNPLPLPRNEDAPEFMIEEEKE